MGLFGEKCIDLFQDGLMDKAHWNDKDNGLGIMKHTILEVCHNNRGNK